jgi:hypothetical protein
MSGVLHTSLTLTRLHGVVFIFMLFLLNEEGHDRLDMFTLGRVFCVVVHYKYISLILLEHWDKPLAVPVHTETRVLKLL